MGQGTLRQSFCDLDECKGLSFLLSLPLVHLWINNEPGFDHFCWSLLGQVDHWIF